jgi:hypothetical protein
LKYSFIAAVTCISFNVHAAFVEAHVLAGTGQSMFDIQKDATTPFYVALDTGVNPGAPSSPGTSQASASADLRTGEIKLYATQTDGSASAWARMRDELTMHLPSSVESVDIGISFSINGIADVNAASSHVNAYLDAGIFGPSRLDTFSCGNTSCNDGAISDTLLAIVNVKDGDVLSVQATLQIGVFETAANGLTSTLDFGHTGTISLDLPEGVTYTSESGVFLSAVPIPAAIWLFGSGLIGLIGLARRKY